MTGLTGKTPYSSAHPANARMTGQETPSVRGVSVRPVINGRTGKN
jgi:hypothetical protein